MQNISNGSSELGLETINSPEFDISIFEVVDGNINLTKMAKYFGKEVRDWTKTNQTKEFLTAFADSQAEGNIITSVKGGDGEQGSWTKYREVAIELARWISPKFAVWANKQIDTLLQKGQVSLQAQPQPKQLSTADILQLATGEIERLQKENQRLTTETTNLATRDLEVKTEKDYKWKSQVLQNDRGRTINYYVNKHFFEGDYREAHNKAKEAYRKATGVNLPNTANSMSQEQKKEYLLWLSKIT